MPLRRIVLVAAALLVAAAPALAVVVRPSESGAPGAAAPPDPGLDHLAIVAGLSGVYLGDGWVLTAGHVVTAARNQKKPDARIGTRTFPLELDRVVPLAAGSERADLALVRIGGDPGLPRLEIARETPAVGTDLILVGNGPLQETRRSCWNASGLEQPASAAKPAGGVCGFKWRKTPENQTNGVQWGTNEVAKIGEQVPGPMGTRTRVFVTEFRDTGATPREAQAGVGDSGGPVFAPSESGHVLAGVMLGIAARSNGVTLFGDRTYVADLAAYREAIVQAMKPEGRARAGPAGR